MVKDKATATRGEYGDPFDPIRTLRLFHEHADEVEYVRTDEVGIIRFDCPRCGEWVMLPIAPSPQ